MLGPEDAKGSRQRANVRRLGETPSLTRETRVVPQKELGHDTQEQTAGPQSLVGRGLYHRGIIIPREDISQRCCGLLIPEETGTLPGL